MATMAPSKPTKTDKNVQSKVTEPLADKAPFREVTPLPFEQPLTDLQAKINDLAATGDAMDDDLSVDMADELTRLRQQAEEVRGRLYTNLSAAHRLQIVRHPQRPNFVELVKAISPDTWFELHGDRGGCDDRAIIGGIAELNDQPVMVVGTQKGRGMRENLTHNFGMANPEGYRKALRLFYHAEKFNMPIITMIDTPGAYPGMDGEQKGIGQAIAFNIREMARLGNPIISVVLGEASSGGALGIGVANRIYMLEHALYTVISPEGCASILWRSAEYASQAADALKITADDLLGFGIADGKIAEPFGGAHHNPDALVASLKEVLINGLAELSGLSKEQLQEQRYNKYRHIGAYELMA